LTSRLAGADQGRLDHHGRAIGTSVIPAATSLAVGVIAHRDDGVGYITAATAQVKRKFSPIFSI